MSFRLHRFCDKWESLDPVNRFNASWVAVDTPTGSPKSVRNDVKFTNDGSYEEICIMDI